MDWGVPSDAETKRFSDGVYIKLSKCPPILQERFIKAREAIKDGQYYALCEAVLSLKAPDVINEFQYPILDVCDEVKDREGVYPMTLLAYAGYHFTTDILQFLIKQGAHVDMGTQESGTPLLQMLVYAYHEQRRKELDRLPVQIDVVKFFIDNGAILSRVLMAPEYNMSTALELAISYQRFDISHLLVERGADPFLCGDGVISPLLLEYVLFGNHRFLQWLLNDYLSQSQISVTKFINHLLNEGVLFRKNMKHTFMEVYGRSPAHALLLCRHKEAIDYLVQRRRELLEECDPFGRTALHLAAEEGDLDSVRILLDCNANVNAEDNSSMTPFMMATINKHSEIIKLLKPRHIGTKRELVWALRNGYSEYFEDMHKTIEGEMKLLESVDSSGNTIAHLAAEDDNTSVFKVTFPATQGSADDPMFEILTQPNFHRKSALHIIIEKGNLEMLDVLHERRAERSKKASKNDIFQQQAEQIEKKNWKEFWDEESQRLLLYACRHGTVEVVDYFLKHSVSQTTMIGGQTPLSCAAEEGKYEIVEYLLNRDVSSTGCGEGKDIPGECQPLMLAAKCGQTNCVILLLEREANSLVQSSRGYNCLMEAISAGHRETAIALLKHDRQQKEAMSHTVQGESGVVVTPLTMLIKEMPGVAKIALNKCLSVGTTSVTYDFEFLEHHKSQPGGVNRTSVCDTLRNGLTSLCQSFKEKHSELRNNPLSTMVKHERLELLQHPLVSRYISLQWWRLFPFIFAHQLVYIIFLVLLTVYAVLTPRPGPDNRYCSSNFSWNSTGSSNYSENSTAGSCFGLAEGDLNLFWVLAVLIILLCIFFLVPQLVPVRIFLSRHTVTAVTVVFIRFLTIVLTIIFVSGFANDCWCAPPWQWQIGALAVFLAYILFILQLGGMPYFGVYIHMLVNIVITFVKLVFLPFFLILSFAIPFYMLFVRERGAMQIEPFSNPARAIFKVIFQTVGQVDFNSLFENGELLYAPVTELLFISFVVLMPLLFITMLVGLAVGTTEKDIENATFKGIELQVEFILTAKIFEPLTKCLWNLPKNLMVYEGTESTDSVTRWMFLRLNKLRGVDCGELAQTLKEDDQSYKVVKENVKSVLGIKNSLLDYTDRGLQNLQSEMKSMRDTLEELQKREKVLSALRSDIRTIKAKLEN